MTAKIPRKSIRINVLVQIIAMFILLVAVNYYSFNHYIRADYSRSQKFVLSEQTKRVIRELKKPVHVVVFFSPTSVAPDRVVFNDLHNLLKELSFSGRKLIEVEYVDPTRDLTRARALQAQYKFSANENIVIVDYDGRSKFVPAGDLGDINLEGIQQGETPRLLSFNGELVLTNAMLSLLSPEKKKIYFLQGHGEPPIEGPTPLGLFREYLQKQNAEALPLSLGSSDSVPSDCSMLVIAAPQVDLTEREAAILDRYWSSEQGRVLTLLDPSARTVQLYRFLARRGVMPMDNRVLCTVRLGFATGILREVTVDFMDKNPVTKRLVGLEMLLSGETQSLLMDPEQAKADKIQLWPLLIAKEKFWGESEYVTDEKKGVRYDEGKDVGYPVYVAVAAARGGVDDDRVDVESSKLVVVGSSQFALDVALTQQPQALDFLMSSANWLLDRRQFTGAVPKKIDQFSINLSDAQLSSISFYILIAIPGVAALFGIVAWIRRRS